MRFLVWRTSEMRDSWQPCAGAVRGDCVRLDERTFATPEQHDEHLPHMPPWLSQGSNHRVENGGIVRDFPDKGWFVEIADLDALLVFCQAHGECVVAASTWMAKGFPEIEIYDDYRE